MSISVCLLGKVGGAVGFVVLGHVVWLVSFLVVPEDVQHLAIEIEVVLFDALGVVFDPGLLYRFPGRRRH